MRLKDIREDRDIAQQTLADYLHIRQNTYSQYETGHRQLPVDILIRLAEFFHTSTDYILGLTDDPTPYPSIPTIPTGKRTVKNRSETEK